MAFGPDGHFYIVGAGEVLRYDGETGRFIGIFIPRDPERLSSPTDLAFGPDRNLYIIQQDSDRVLRYDGATGAFIDTFIVAAEDQAIGHNVLLFRQQADLINRE
jgi:hypothetical protein